MISGVKNINLFSLNDIFNVTIKQTNNDSSNDSSDTDEEELEKSKYEDDSVENEYNIEDSIICDPEEQNTDIKVENNKALNIFETFSDNKNFSFNLEKFYNDINLSKINQNLGKQFEDSYNRYKNILNKLFHEDKNSDNESNSDCNIKSRKNKKNKGKYKKSS